MTEHSSQEGTEAAQAMQKAQAAKQQALQLQAAASQMQAAQQGMREVCASLIPVIIQMMHGLLVCLMQL